jgi:hypothetical protein
LGLVADYVNARGIAREKAHVDMSADKFGIDT